MSNSHLKIAIGAATLATLCAAAQAQQSAPQIYGQFGVGLTTRSGVSTTTAKTDLGDATIASSFFGFRGSEELDGGMKAVYRLEAGMAPDSGVVGGTVGGINRLFNKQSFIGLEFGSTGTLTFGRQFHAAVDRVVRSIDPQNAAGGVVVTPIGLFGVNRFYSNDTRVDNSIKYRVVGPAGLEGSASYGFSEDVAGTSYSAEVAKLTEAYQIGLYMVNYRAPNVVAGVGNRPEHEIWGGGVNVPVGPVRLYANYVASKLDATVAGRGTQSNRVTTLAVVWKPSVYTFKMIYFYDQGTKLNGVDGRDGVKDTLVASATYSFSKRTSLYGALFANRFADGYLLESVNLSALGRAPTSSTVSGISTGMIHRF